MSKPLELERIARARTPQELPLFLTVPEAAEVLRRGRPFVYQAVHDGRLPAVRSGRGGKIMINRDMLLQWGRAGADASVSRVPLLTNPIAQSVSRPLAQ